MAERPNVLKASIVKVDSAGRVVSDKEMECQFNPTDFEVSRTIEWNEDTNVGGDAAQLSFGGGKAQDLTVPLLFDTTDSGKDVRKSYKTLRELAMVSRQAESVPEVAETPPETGESPEAETSEVDLDSLARQIYPLVKRLLAVERERRPIRYRGRL